MHTDPQPESRAADDEREIAEALAALGRGAPQAMQRLIPRVYGELRRIAHRQLAAERGDHTLSTTAVVHEAYLRLIDQHDEAWNDRAHFFALAAGVMRRVLTDYARRHKAARRGGPSASRVALDDADAAGVLVAGERASELLALDEALIRLGRVDARMAQIVECRVYGGLSAAETATALGTSLRTVEREWALAKGWLYQELRDDAG
ncbi:MAG: ECF-type sigma factor [Kofleriaceae bacterium]